MLYHQSISTLLTKSTIDAQQTPLKQSTYDYPDITKSKFFQLKHYQQLNHLFHSDIQSLYHNKSSHHHNNKSYNHHNKSQMISQDDSKILLTQSRVFPNEILNQQQSRISFFDMSKLQQKKKKTGFMFDSFNVFNQSNQLNNNILHQNNSLQYSRFSNHYNYQNLSSSQNNLAQNKNQQILNLSNSAISNQQNTKPLKQKKNILQGLTQKQIHQTNEIKLQFKLNLKRPQFCMGAFSHSQTNFFGTGINININLPSLQEHKPFSSILGNSQSSLINNKSFNIDQSIFNKIKQSQSRFFKGIQKSNINVNEQNKVVNNNSQSLQKAKQQQKALQQQRNKKGKQLYGLSCIDEKIRSEQQVNIQRALQLGLIQLQTNQISFIQHKQHQEQQQLFQLQHNLSESIFNNYQLLLKQPQYDQLPVWQSRVTQYNQHNNYYNQHNNNYNQHNNYIMSQSKNQSLINSFQVSYQWHQSQLLALQSQFSVKKDSLYMISDNKLFILVTQMLQGIQNNLFLLDYDKLQWYIDMKGFRFQHSLRSSFVTFMKDILQLANMRSRLDKAVQYMSMRQFRRVYFEISKQVKQVLRVFEQYILQFIQDCNYGGQKRQLQKQGLIQFMINIQQLIPQIKILYELLISEKDICRDELSYFVFDHRYLNSQFQVFESILRISRQVDQTNTKISQLIKNLLKSAFKPIISSLNNILFQQQTSITSKQQIYLKYYYQSTKQLFNQISRKMVIVHQQSPQLYFICKQKLSINIEFNIQTLTNYYNQWSKLFYYKYIQLQFILNQMMNKQHQNKHKIQKHKQLQLQRLKRKLKQKSQKQYEIKLYQKQKRDQQLNMLIKQIKSKQQQKRLQDLIQKQTQRGYLLQDQLHKKISLLKQKQRLIKLYQQQHANHDKQNQQGQKQGQNSQKYIINNQTKQIISQNKQIKPKKWNNQQQLQINYIQKKQKKQISQNIISQQIILPVVNELKNKNKNENNQITQKLLQVQVQNEQPKSPKSPKSKKIKKQINTIRNINQIGKIKSFKSKRQGAGKIYFNKNIIINKNQQHPINNSQQINLINFNELCQKNKKLIFTIGQQSNKNNHITIQDIQSDTNSSLQNSQLQQLQQMQQQIYSHHINHNSSQLSSYMTKQQYIPTNCIFQICIDKVLHHQTSIINNCYQILIFQKYHFKEIIKFIKSIFLSQNGQNHKQLLQMAINSRTSNMSLKCFNQSFLFDNLPSFLKQLKPSFYNTRQQSLQQIQQRLLQHSNGSVNAYYGQFNIISQNLQQYIGFQFMNLPQILQTYFSYIHLSKYMQIFSFILRIKHCQSLISQSWILLNNYKKQLFKKNRQMNNSINNKYYNQYSKYYSQQQQSKYRYQTKLLNQLFVTRHLIQSFLTTYQNYIFFRVIQKQFKSLNKKIEKHQLFDLQNSHIKLLDTIIRFAFVDNSVNNITKEIRRLLQFIRQFRNIVDLICSDDILSQQKQQIRIKIKFIHSSFKQNHKFFQALYFKT